MVKRGGSGDRSQNSSRPAGRPRQPGVRRWLRQTIRSILRIFGFGGPSYKTPQILATHTTDKYILRQLARNDAEAIRNVSTWLRIQRSGTGHDVLVVLDTLSLISGEKSPFKGFKDATHRVAVLEISSLGGRRRARCLFLGDFDFVGALGLAWGAGDRLACSIIRALAFQLTKEPWDALTVPWVEQLEFYARHYLGESHYPQGPPGRYRDPPPDTPTSAGFLSFQLTPQLILSLQFIRLSSKEPHLASQALVRLLLLERIDLN